MENTEGDHETGGTYVHEGNPNRLVAVMCVFDAGLLGANADEVHGRLATDSCLVVETSDRAVGALALDGDYVGAVTISPSRRGRRVGTRLIRATFDHRGRLVVGSNEGVKPFYESPGFDIEDRNDDKGWFRGVLHGG